ncbi:hypothetical protein U4W14_04970 [Enterobacter hormaechei]|uniref:hypothetical protein n=1 Tax=Enterobacter hormaechei TaxID=158836 RepID=UPI0030901E18|nr:hypothetical protein U4W14_04970 [Enterobacter hormaechei]
MVSVLVISTHKQYASVVMRKEYAPFIVHRWPDGTTETLPVHMVFGTEAEGNVTVKLIASRSAPSFTEIQTEWQQLDQHVK